MKHEMRSVQVYSTSAERWVCPVCAREIVLMWGPPFRLVILEYGETEISHSCEKRVKVEVEVGQDVLPDIWKDAIDDIDS